MSATVERRAALRESGRIANRQRQIVEQTVIIDRLSKADYKRRLELEADPEAWIWEMCGPDSGLSQPLAKKFTSQQCDMIGAYHETLAHGGDEMMLASRGEGKTTYLRAAIWKSVSEGSADFIAYIGASGDDATNSREAIQDMVQRSVPYHRYYPEIATPALRVGKTSQLAGGMRATGYRMDTGKQYFQEPISFLWSNKGIDFPDVPGAPGARAILRFRGADKSIRGLNIRGKRPTIVVMDDLDSLDTVNNPDVAAKVVARVDTDIGGLGSPTEPMARIMLATLPKQGCGVAYHYAKTGHPFVVKKYKYLLEKPIRWDLWMTYVKLRQKGKVAGDKYGRKAHKFYVDNRADMDAGAKVSNEWRYVDAMLPDGTQQELSAVQAYFDAWADKGEMYCRCELDNEIVETEELIQSQLEVGHVSNCEGSFSRGIVDEGTTMTVRGIDVRKIELHHVVLSMDAKRLHRIPDYGAEPHASTEIDVQMAERLILQGLHSLADHWDSTEPLTDPHGNPVGVDLCLVDAGWLGSWDEDGETKYWASQPVETFCGARGLRRWMPCKGDGGYRKPKPGRNVIIGEHWHILVTRSPKMLLCVWSVEYFRGLIEDLFVTDDDELKFELFAAEGGIFADHRRFAQHMANGANELAEQRRKSVRTRKRKFRRDHWWDSLAMCLVAQSVEQHLRQNDPLRSWLVGDRRRKTLADLQREARG